MNLIDDLSTVTTIQKASLNNLADTASACICHDVLEEFRKGCVSKVDIGIGTLIIKVTDVVEYKFIPSPKFEGQLKTALLSGKDPLSSMIEEKLVDKVLRAYKDII